MEQLCAPIELRKPVRLIVAGNLSRSKGLGVVIALSRLAVRHQIELHLLGTSTEGLAGPNVINHGPYQRESFSRKVAEINPHLGGVFSICHETFCHTLTELWSCGVPVIGFDLGAVGERMRETGAGWLASNATAESVLQVIDQLRRNPELQEQAKNCVLKWQKGEGKRQDRHAMGHKYYDLYRELLSASAPARQSH